MIKRYLLTIACMAGCVVHAGTAAAQNGIVIDWSTRTVVTSPGSLGASMSTVVVLRNVNDVLYDYEVDIKEVRRQLDDFSNLVGVVTAGPRSFAPGDVCPVQDASQKLSEASEALRTSPELSPVAGKDGKFASVRLSATREAWETKVAPPLAEARALASTIRQRLKDCADPKAAAAFLEREYGPFDALMRPVETKVQGPHAIQVPITLYPDADYTIVVTEKYKGTVTLDGLKNFVVSPASTVLTLSSGFGATWLEGRSYVASNVPGASTGDPNRIQLKVDGLGVRPVVPLLLNYQLPIRPTGDWGVALSSGPVVAFGSGTANTSSLGFFGGVSVHLFHRLLITPGMHLGEFADYPLGLSSEGAPIPDKFGELNPRKRWTTRFAVMVTFRTLDLSKVISKPKVTASDPKAAESKPGEKPAEPPAAPEKKKGSGSIY